MTSLDDELLALAGDSSDEEEVSSPQPKLASASPRPISSSQEAKRSPPQKSNDMARKGVAKAVKPARSAKRTKRPKKEESDEEGELSAAESHDSNASAAMEESDADEPSLRVDGDGPIFPYEKLYYSAKDKQEIMAMPEIEREQILSERSQQVDRHNQDVVLRRLLASREREQARSESKAKRKASAAELEDGQRKSSRQKTTLGGRKVGEASDAIEAYKRQREQKGKRDEQRRREADSRQNRARSSSHEEGAYSDVDAEGESEVEYEDRVRRSPSGPPVPKDDPPAELKDIQRVRVGRSNFASVCFHPTFAQSLTGCFARVNIGPNRDTGQNEYRVCIIKRFTQGRPYSIEGTNGRTYITDSYAVLAHGKAEREFPFIQCSDSLFTEAEFNRWRQTMAVEDCKVPTKSTLSAKVVDINKLINYKFSAEELEEKLRKQGSSNVNEKLLKRFELERKLNEAIAESNDDEIGDIQAQLAKESTPKLGSGISLNKPRLEKQQTPEQRLAELNRRNQRLNSENVRRAQLEERRINREKAAAVARGEATADPFSRVRTLAKTHHDVNAPRGTPKKEDVVEGTNGSSTTANDFTSSPTLKDTPTGSQTKPKGIAVIRHRNMDDENIAALDLDLDGDFDLGI
ncbi:putative RNA polymerase II transcription elongation factor Rtf1p [Talaromyces proteolyticus]|uniref:RNA polymerase II transcription elongation factor Rtf1p n=1 Tax=Talaromyces proteolyticus TaxID=1131652 RepID=A0AAD4Q4R5_9EURO|nr:putative RNA polymerase II transcription elongation factor Rtf1p [Talaromyces proteolyticus]KAH8703280.1 putative RNA polymerase II transcription elongation factor Rtf1p [Talaromyces proteolyticus]